MSLDNLSHSEYKTTMATKRPTKQEEGMPTYQLTPKVQPKGEIGSEDEIQSGLQAGPKVDIGKALKMRINNHLSYQEIADKFGCSKTYIYKVLHEFEALIKDPEAAQAYHDNKAGLLTGIELSLAKQMGNEGVLKGASLNNLAYAFQQIHNAGRLERGASTSNVSHMSHIIHDVHADMLREAPPGIDTPIDTLPSSTP